MNGADAVVGASGMGALDMNEKKRKLVGYLGELAAISPLGYTVGLHIRFASPLYFKSTYPQAWQELYTSNNYALRDPLVFWGISQTGVTRWSRIALPDPFDVLPQAHAHGMRYGVLAACGKVTSRSIVGVTRSDREFDDAEVATVDRVAKALHEVAEAPEALSASMIDALRLLNDGYRRSAAAASLGISEGVLDARLTSAQDRLGAQNTDEALRMAKEYRLI